MKLEAYYFDDTYKLCDYVNQFKVRVENILFVNGQFVLFCWKE